MWKMWISLTSFTLFLIIHRACHAAQEVPRNQDNINICSDSCHPHDCSDVWAQGLKTDGVYLIYPGGLSTPVPVYCDMTGKDGTWTVFQKRFDGKVNFYRGLKEYKAGFGRVDGEYWLAGDSLTGQAGMNFSTYDNDRDIWSSNCAETFHGAFWYSDCHGSNLNGKYQNGVTTEYATGVVWSTNKGAYYSFKKTVMKIAPSVPAV
ncbi:PREDICTED: microfibril-associated glycoprotein 4-like [Nanorana parkeri]|uniref:microfibril-associated glycoprotein 4-like n=1 Tax=Nanorana parkeri TaxID=125878 RepID=UPI0008549FFD|nr:PREDICTED: microfibril-associated glycoprotein 4-like [Nanorana parkeri]